MTGNGAWVEIERAFARRGDQSYGEGVSQRAHALQCATLAEQRGAPPSEIVAALLHDIGHLIHDLPETIADDGIDTEHESLGA
ncbi:MAG: phosphohydrolase, partial [Dongiaceae bacterium]